MPTPNIRPVPNLPEYRFNEATNQYIDSSGRFVSRNVIRGQLDTFIQGSVDLIEQLSRRLIAGEIGLGEWQLSMMELSKAVNLAGAASQAGGWYQLSQSDFGFVGNKLRQEYSFIRQFAGQIESGQQKLDGTLVRRSKLYGEQGRSIYYDFAHRQARADGFDEEKSVLTPADHCDDCVAEDAAGFRPLGTMVPIGDRICKSNCKCFAVYRNSKTGEERIG